ncbi:universal stress protein [Fulvivirga sp. RKSG066]|uniref:universal stress protein n=1 Tax=Fulvivirga aurantia TaxID=2529383 RepID=UPI0012BBCCC6|nr:universal stress protein [Fulvivirga aurantia]MTI20849.1 universal stress protein [Fulvivirga aurantia]
MEQIMVPIDFTKASVAGVEKAISIAIERDAELHLVNIIAPIKSGPLEIQLDHTLNLLREHEAKLSSLLTEVDRRGVKINSKIQVANFEKGIKKYLKDHKIDLIVVGINGSHTVGDLFCVGRDEKLIKVSCPIEVVKQAS